MKVFFILFFLKLSLSCFSQKINYNDYHKNINKAEELFFTKKKVDSAIYYYDKVFCNYDFIFVKDLVNAAQIAIYSNKPYKQYIERGFDFGLKLKHLEKYPLFNKVLPSLQKNKKINTVYNFKRKEYLKKIDSKYLDWLYKLAIRDQVEKRKTWFTYMNNVIISTNKLIDSTKNRGFPSDKTIGISDSLIFKEINKPWLDLYQQRKNDKGLFYMTSDEEYLSSCTYQMVMLVHNPCSFFLYKNIFLEEMEKGNIHPRDIALIYDNTYRYLDVLPSFCKVKMKGAYFLNMFTHYPKDITIKEVNEMRKKLHIVSTDVDDKKKEYEIKYGFKLFSGFWFCR